MKKITLILTIVIITMTSYGQNFTAQLKNAKDYASIDAAFGAIKKQKSHLFWLLHKQRNTKFNGHPIWDICLNH